LLSAVVQAAVRDPFFTVPHALVGDAVEAAPAGVSQHLGVAGQAIFSQLAAVGFNPAPLPCVL
jgi:hypothetical protein